MKHTLSALLLVIIPTLCFCQAKNGTVSYRNSNLPAAVIELPYETWLVNEAMNDYLSKKGKSKKTEMKGFYAFRNTGVVLNETPNADLYFKVESKSKKEKMISVVSLLLRQPDAADAAANYLNMEEAIAYLNNLAPAIAAHNLEVMINNQNAEIIKSESKLKQLTGEGEDIQKKIIAAQKSLDDNKAKLELQSADVESQKAKLSALISKRGN